MHRNFVRSVPAAILLGATLTLTGCSSSGSPTPSTTGVASARHLDVRSFASLAATPAVVLVDVRTPQEFAAGHLAGAVNIDIEAADFGTRIHALDHSRTYAVYCHSGNRSGRALDLMTADGFGHVADLSGGISAWIADGGSVVTS